MNDGLEFLRAVEATTAKEASEIARGVMPDLSGEFKDAALRYAGAAMIEAVQQRKAAEAERDALRAEARDIAKILAIGGKASGLPDGTGSFDVVQTVIKKAAEMEAERNALRAENERLREALTDATANLAGAASAYRKYAGRSHTVGRGCPDPFFTTRVSDLDRAVDRARAALATQEPTP